LDDGGKARTELRRVLDAMRHARPVGASPLLDLAVVRGKTDRELALYELLADVIQERWTLERRTMGLPADVTGSVSDGTALLQDFGANSVDLESWSVIFHRYLAGGGLAVGRIAEIIGEGWPHARRLVYRRHERGLQLLTDALVTREAIAPFGVPRLAPGNLPRRRSSFVGREESVVEVARLVSRERLLTLVGRNMARRIRTSNLRYSGRAGRCRRTRCT
jgi:hypothetical protein